MVPPRGMEGQALDRQVNGAVCEFASMPVCIFEICDLCGQFQTTSNGFLNESMHVDASQCMFLRLPACCFSRLVGPPKILW